MADLHAKIRAGRLMEVHKLLTSLGVEEATFDVVGDGWGVAVTDKSHVAMVAGLVKRQAFDLYDLDHPCRMPLVMERLKNALQRAHRDDVVEIDLDGAHLRLRCGNLNWRMRLAEDGGKEPNLPQWAVDVKASVPVSELVTCSRVAACVSDHVTMTAQGDALTLATVTEEDEVEMKLPIPAVLGQARTMVPLDYFQAMVKALPQEMVTLEIATDRPIAAVIDGWDGNIIGKYLIAPRIEDGD